MKIYITGTNSKENVNLSEKLKDIYNINLFEIDNDIREINKVIIKNREWIIASKYSESSSVIASSATTVIYLDFDKKEKISNNDFIKKYANKIIILKSKKETKKLIKAIYEGIEL